MELVRVRLRKPRRVYTFQSDNIPLQRDEFCIVESDRGVEWGTCILPPEPCPDEMLDRYPMHILRSITEDDMADFNQILKDEAEAYKVCQEKIRLHELPMKLVDVEYTFDKKKVVFYFTAEDRVDFRELVRDLAHDLRTRIELRHIQVRDEAKMVGGIGSCGRELCCTTWLNDFMPISMRMAKRQNLSLNPSKISGQCGRLLCCLSYENDQYETAKQRANRMQAKPDEQDDDNLDVVPQDIEEDIPVSKVVVDKVPVEKAPAKPAVKATQIASSNETGSETNRETGKEPSEITQSSADTTASESKKTQGGKSRRRRLKRKLNKRTPDSNQPDDSKGGA